jgi:gamma-glutamyltranspeptidase/glutathione hydrolase
MIRTLAGYALSGDRSVRPTAAPPRRGSKAAYWVRDNFICDPEQVPSMSPSFVEARAERARRTIASTARSRPRWAEIEHKDTVYLCTVDRDGNAARSSTRCSRLSGRHPGAASGVLPHNRGTGFRTIRGTPTRSRRASAAPHDHPGDAGQGRPRGDALRCDGRTHQAVGHAHSSTAFSTAAWTHSRRRAAAHPPQWRAAGRTRQS